MITIKINGTEYRAIKSSQLLTKCKKIFGVALKAVYIVDNYRLESSYSSKEESAEYLKLAHIKITKGISVDFDTAELILEFESGNHVLFSASESAQFIKVEVKVV